MEHERRVYEFGDFRVDALKRVVSTRDGKPVRITPKALDTLLYLLEHRDGFSTKDVLMQAIWPGRIVEDNNVDQNIAALRRALGEKRDDHRYIVTVPGRGYRFIAELGSIATSPRGGVSPPIRSIAVLPFRPLVPATQDVALEMGMADTLISRLSAIREITVRPLGAVRRYAGLEHDPLDAGRELAVAAVLEGHLQRWGDKVRVSVRLLRVTDAVALWSRRFDERFDDIFDLQDSIAEHVVAALTVELDGEERVRLTRHSTENSAAYSHYLKGRFYWWKHAPEEFARCREHFQQAVDADPRYALGYCGLNSYYGFGAAFGLLPADDAWPRAEDAIAKALVLDDCLAEAHTGLAALRLVRYRDWAGAERAVHRAIALNPGFDEVHYFYSFLLLAAGRFDEAVAEGRRALSIDPFSPRMNEHLGKCLLFAGHSDEAIRQLRHALEFAADNVPARELLGDAYEIAGRPSEAVAEWHATLLLTGEPDLADELTTAWNRGGIGDAVRTVAHRRAKHLEAEAANGRPVPAAMLARQCARAGERDLALGHIERACDERNVFALLIARDPAYAEMRADPRFVRSIERLRPPTTAQSAP